MDLSSHHWHSSISGFVRTLRPTASILNNFAFVAKVPRLQTFDVFGIALTDKFFVYLMAGQMAMTNFSTILTAAIGIITGCIYHFDVVGLDRWAHGRRPSLTPALPFLILTKG